ncbi:MAG: hypothetical protein ACP5G7_05575 [Anaerolineae bacterium]
MMQESESYPVNVKLGVKPVVVVPEDIPRVLGEMPLSREECQKRGEEAAAQLAETHGAAVEILSPAVIENGADVEALKEDVGHTDLYWVSGAGRGRTPFVLELARRYGKPLIGGGGVGLPPFLRSHGLEAYPVLDDDLVSLLRTRKALTLTRALVVQSRRVAGGCLSSAWDLDDLEARFGIGFDLISDEMLFAEMGNADRDEAQKLAQGLIKGAVAVNLDERYVTNSTQLYLAVDAMMERHSCNALTVGCCESPFLDLEMEHKTTPCLATSLLNERGLAASCQGDVSALLTVAVMIYLSRKSVFMGNLGTADDNGLISISHSAPGLRMDGLDAPRLPYGLHPFGVMEWGTAVHVDLLQAKDTHATVARFDPLAERLLVTTGQIVQSVTVEKFCKQMVQIRVPDAAAFQRRAHTDYGGHFTVVCGDYVRQLEDLADMLGFQVELL